MRSPYLNMRYLCGVFRSSGVQPEGTPCKSVTVPAAVISAEAAHHVTAPGTRKAREGDAGEE